MSLQRHEDETLIKSYRYLRTAMVGLVFCLGVAVVFQTIEQKSILSSISAYYYTPAQAIFVGALIAIGVCMIALKGTTEQEDVLLNIAGMLAPVVAIVPTARGADYRAAVVACRESDGSIFTDQALMPVDCPSIRALATATQANIDNNMVALLAVGAAALLTTLLFARRDRHPFKRFWLSFAFAVGVYALAAITFVVYTQGFIDNAHYVAAFGLFACIVAVAVVNALRHQGERLARVNGLRVNTKKVTAALFRSPDRYAGVALAMVAAVLVGGALLIWGPWADTLFWLEASLIVLFATFWVIQTKEQWHQDRTLL